METIFERVGALDVHKAQVTACVRVPDAERAAREPQLAEFSTTVAGLLALRDWLAALPGHARGDGGDRRVLAAGLAHPGGRFRADVVQRAARQAGPRPQDRRLRRAVAVPADGGRAVARQLRAAQAAAAAADADPVSQDADRGAPARGQPAAQGAGGHRDQARLRRHRHPRRVGPRDARRARGRAPPTPRCSPSSRKGKLRAKIPALQRGARGPLRGPPRAGDRRDPRPPRLPRRADRPALRSDRGSSSALSRSRRRARRRTLTGVAARTAEVDGR